MGFGNRTPTDTRAGRHWINPSRRKELPPCPIQLRVVTRHLDEQGQSTPLVVEPDNVELLNAMGFSLFQQGKSEEAVVTYRQLVKEHPGSAGHEELARLLEKLGRAQDVPAI